MEWNLYSVSTMFLIVACTTMAAQEAYKRGQGSEGERAPAPQA